METYNYYTFTVENYVETLQDCPLQLLLATKLLVV